MLDGSRRRCTLSDAKQVIRQQMQDSLGAGVDLDGVWVLKSGIVVVRTDNRWDAGQGRVVGVTYHEADQDEIGRLAERYGCDELVAKLPEIQ
ncbi:MAG: hypothetical protein PHS14_19045 [Elusimicrobia bacterium]|nr:hypothetical protein [Elusimicrobiota bacterium]